MPGRDLAQHRVNKKYLLFAREVEKMRMFSDFDLPATFLRVEDAFHVSSRLENEAESIGIVEQYVRIIDGEAQLANRPVIRVDVPVAEDSKVGEHTSEVVALVPSHAGPRS